MDVIFLKETLSQETSNKEDLEIATSWVFLLPPQRIQIEFENYLIKAWQNKAATLLTSPKMERLSKLLLMTSSHACIGNQSFQVLTVKSFGFLSLRKSGVKFMDLTKESKQDNLTMHSEISQVHHLGNTFLTAQIKMYSKWSSGMIEKTSSCVPDALQTLKSKQRSSNKWVWSKVMLTVSLEPTKETAFNLYKLETHGVNTNGLEIGVTTLLSGLKN